MYLRTYIHVLYRYPMVQMSFDPPIFSVRFLIAMSMSLRAAERAICRPLLRLAKLADKNPATWRWYHQNWDLIDKE